MRRLFPRSSRSNGLRLKIRAWRRGLTSHMEPWVFFGAAGVVVGFCLLGGLATDTAAAAFNTLRTTVIDLFGWYYALVVSAVLLATLWLLLGPFGRVRLGADSDRPEFGYLGWFAMLFSAGMGTGIVFWGVAEPLYHYAEPFFGPGRTEQAARDAMRHSYFHWGLHAWAIYALFGVTLAYLHFRKDLPLAPRSMLQPLLGTRMYGPLGHTVDILCTVGTLLGVATSLGLGAMQINAGVATVYPVAQSVTVQLAVIATITAVATLSVVSGLHSGIQRLSQTNLVLAFLLMLFVFLAGPTLAVLETFMGTTALYLQNLPQMSLFTSFAQDTGWQAQWTFFYWGWWISWSPFVGIFVGRISKGRTIREFVGAVLIVPTLGTFVWLAVFGGTALHMELFGGAAGLTERVQDNLAVSLHALLDRLPWAPVMQSLATLVIVLFFITSSDSGSFVDDMVTSGGDPNPPRAQRVFWAISEGAVAATLLAVGGLRAIQDASISLGFFMSFLLILAFISLRRCLVHTERRQRGTDG